MSEEFIDKYRTLNDEQYKAMLVILDVVRTRMVIHHKDGDTPPTPLTKNLENNFEEVQKRDDYVDLIEGARSFVENQFPAMDIDTGISIINEIV
tara:strand:- start:2285 stop:2566 length:282 start_codon:yes stop_codon:yes gene_type:complete